MTDNRQSMPTLADVAARAGVSTATVSRYLNASGQLGAETAQKVQDAVKALGYSPNFGAQALAARRTNTVGAIIPTMENSIFATGIQAFQEAISAAGKTLLLASSAYDGKTEEQQIRTLVARGAEGLLLIGHARSAEIYEFLEARQMPVVISWVHDASAPRPSVGFDNFTAMQDLTTRAIDLGHRQIGMISAYQSGNDRVQARVAGVRAAMVEAGLSPDDLALIETPYGMATGAAAFSELMSGGTRPTLAICANDVLAVGAMRRAAEMGMKIPQDISITGFDDMELSTITDPALTTVQVPHFDMGDRAAKMLMDMIDGQTPQQNIVLPTAPQMRGTLGPAPTT